MPGLMLDRISLLVPHDHFDGVRESDWKHIERQHQTKKLSALTERLVQKIHSSNSKSFKTAA
jgi:hypothetical protein